MDYCELIEISAQRGQAVATKRVDVGYLKEST
jgi:hypothetical protein